MSEPVPLRESIAEYLANHNLAKTLVIHFDGSCEPTNPGGIATCGWTIRSGDELICSGCREVGRGDGMSNNVAEWSALGFALRWLLDHKLGGGCVLEIRGDSQLVIRQLTGEYGCHKPHLQKLLDRCHALLGEICPASWKAVWIPREQNAEADALSRRAYEEATGKTYPERVRR